MSETKAEIAVETWSYWLHPIFSRCVDPDGTRYDLSLPFVIEEYVYATNARIAVRMPTPGGWTIPNAERLPPIDQYFTEHLWRPDPTQFPPVEGTCEVCKGAKVMPEVDCPWCLAESPGPYEAGFCDECYSLEGKIPAGPCYECQGSGILDSFGRLEVTPCYWLQRRYVALLHEFEMTTYLPVELSEKHVTRFTLGDITGILMPMTAPDSGRRG